MIIYCGKCGKKLLPDDSAGGKVGICAGCKTKIPIPKKDAKRRPLCLFCPECKAKLAAPHTLAGKEMVCPKCDATFGLPQLEEKKADTPGSKIIDSGLFGLEEVEELRKITPPPPPASAAAASEEALASAPGPAIRRPPVKTVATIVVAVLVLVQLAREIKLNLAVADAQKLAAEEEFGDAAEKLDGVISSGTLTVAKWRAGDLRMEYDKAARAKEAFDAAMEFANQNSEDYAGSLALLEEVSERFEGSPHGERANASARELGRKIDVLAKPVLEKLLQESKELVFAGKFDEAQKHVAAFPDVYRSAKWQSKHDDACKAIAKRVAFVKEQLARGAALHNGRLVTAKHKEHLDKKAFEQEQEAKGLVKVGDEWIAKEEKERRERERVESARRTKGMVQLSRDKWLTKEENERRKRRVRVESMLPKGSGLPLLDALQRAGMTGSTEAEKIDCAYLLRAAHKIEAQPSLRSPGMGHTRVTVTVTAFELSIEDPDRPAEELVIKEKELFSLSEVGRRSLTQKHRTGEDLNSELAIAALEAGAVANALGFMEHKVTSGFKEIVGLTPEEMSKRRRAEAEKLMKTFRGARGNVTRQKTLEKIKELGTDAVPAIIDGLEHPDPTARLALVKALGDVGDPSALHVLRQVEMKAERREEGADVGKAANEAIKKIIKRKDEARSK